jgi:hypothetical protein
VAIHVPYELIISRIDPLDQTKWIYPSGNWCRCGRMTKENSNHINKSMKPWLKVYGSAVYLSILSLAPHEPYWTTWAKILQPANFFGPSQVRNVVFSYFTLYNTRAVPPKSGPVRKLRSDASSGMVIGRIFSARNNRKNFQPGPNPARLEKCSGLLGRDLSGKASHICTYHKEK